MLRNGALYFSRKHVYVYRHKNVWGSISVPSLSTMTCSHFIFSTFSSDCKAVRCFSISMHSCLQYSLKKMSLETFELCAHLLEKSCGSNTGTTIIWSYSNIAYRLASKIVFLFSQVLLVRDCTWGFFHGKNYSLVARKELSRFYFSQFSHCPSDT